jgi:tetratricopeptide (TPR) repeat protein
MCFHGVPRNSIKSFREVDRAPFTIGEGALLPIGKDQTWDSGRKIDRTPKLCQFLVFIFDCRPVSIVRRTFASVQQYWGSSMSKAFCAAYFFLFHLAIGGAANADPLKDCGDVTLGEVTIAGCTKLIDSGRYKGGSASGVLNNRGVAKQNQGDFEGAISDYEAAIRANAKNALPRMNLARALTSLERFDEGIDAATAGIRITPTAQNYVIRAEVFERSGRLEKAIPDYDEAIKRQPIASTYSSRAFVRAQLSHHQEAIEDYSKAISLNDRNPAFYAGRGIAWANAGKCDQALLDYDKAILLSPRMSLAYNNRGICKLRRGDRDGARADYEAALRYDPGNSKAKTNLDILNGDDAPFTRPLPPAQMPRFELPDTKKLLEGPEFILEEKKE